jgi:proline iminopeptidase
MRRPTTTPAAHRTRPGRIPIRDTSLYIDVTGHGYPLLLMHGGPGADHWTLLPFQQLADQFTLIFYDHRCNGRSQGSPVSSMTFENLTADADALRRRLGYQRWAVLGHSFGGHVALEYALRYPAACRTWCSSTPAATAAGHGTTPPRCSPTAATARRR